MDVDGLFKSHVLNDEGMEKAKEIGAKFDSLLKDLQAVLTHDGRELSLVKTKLEEACFYAKKALAKQSAYQR